MGAQREQRIDQRIAEFVARLQEGDSVTEQDFLALFPELSHEQEERLRLAKMVIAAGDKIRDAEPEFGREPVPVDSESQCSVAARDLTPAAETGRNSTRIVCPHCHTVNSSSVVKDGNVVTCMSCGSAFVVTSSSDSVSGLRPGDSVGRFELISVVGSGGFGKVWRARDPQLDRVVAIKIPRREDLSAEEAEWFLREARHAAHIHHPNVVPIHEVGRDGDRIYLVCDLIDGPSLAQRLKQRPTTISEAVELAQVVACALDHVHKSGIVHRDLKPNNILLDDAGTPYVVDFGLARREQNDITLTLDGNIIGTPAYMSPEQARGDSHNADARSDVYSLGVVFFEMLTGEIPFRGLPHAIFDQIVSDEPPDPRRLNPLLPRDLATLCLKCMEKRPENRFASASEFADELTRFERGEPIHSRSIHPLERGWRWSRRRPYAAGLILVLTAAAFIAPLLAFNFFRIARSALESQQATVASELQKSQLLYSFQMSAVQNAMEDEIAPDIQLAGRLLDQHVPAPGEADLRDFEWYYWQKRRNRGLLWEKKLARPESLAVSADANWLAIGSVAGFVRIEHLKSGESFEIAAEPSPDGQPSSVYCVAFSPDSRFVAFGTGTETSVVEVLEVATRKRIVKFQPTGDWVQTIDFSPDGDRIAIGTFTGTVEFWQALDRDSHVTLKTSDNLVRSLAFSPDGKHLATQGGEYRGSRGEIRIIEVEGNEIVAKRDFAAKKLGWSITWNHDGTSVFVAPEAAFSVDSFSASDLSDEAVRFECDSRSRVGSFAISPDRSRLVAGATDGTLVAWDLATGRVARTWPGHVAEVMEIEFSPDGRQIVTCGRDGFVRCWSYEDDSFSKLPIELQMQCTSLGFSSDGSELFSSGYDYEEGVGLRSIVSTWHRDDHDQSWSVEFPNCGSDSLLANRSNPGWFSGHSDGRLRQWDVDGNCVQEFTLSELNGQIWALPHSISADGTRLAASVTQSSVMESGTLRQEVVIIELGSGRILKRWKAHDRVVLEVAFHPTADELFSVGYDKVVRHWTVTGKLLSEFALGRRVAGNLHFVDGGQILVAIDSDGTIWRIPLTSEDRLSPITQRNGFAARSSISPNGNTLAIPFRGGDGQRRDQPGEIRLFDTRTWEVKTEFAVEGAPSFCRFSPNGRELAVGTLSGNLFIWRGETDASTKRNASEIPL